MIALPPAFFTMSVQDAYTHIAAPARLIKLSGILLFFLRCRGQADVPHVVSTVEIVARRSSLSTGFSRK